MIIILSIQFITFRFLKNQRTVQLMKIINNQDTRLIDELHELVKDSSNIYLSCSQNESY